jgi:hypothetical protein
MGEALGDGDMRAQCNNYATECARARCTLQGLHAPWMSARSWLKRTSSWFKPGLLAVEAGQLSLAGLASSGWKLGVR